jgi:acetyl esterase/lipase
MLLPFRFPRDGIEITRELRYGEANRNVLDVYRPTAAEWSGRSLPIVLQVHGGGWMVGNKAQQGQPLLSRLVPTGFVGVSVNYRLAPGAVFPAQLIDVKRAIAWVKEHVAEYGGDADRIVITGGSAGGHLASLAALTPNAPEYQPSFEDVDTSVMACIDFYGPSDFTDRLGVRGRLSSYEVFLSRVVMPGKLADHPELYAAMSPVEHVNPSAPPFLIVQGELDVLVWREESEAFAGELAAVSDQPVVYWEVPGAQHAFDIFNSRRSAAAVDVSERFAAVVEARWTRAQVDPDR